MTIFEILPMLFAVTLGLAIYYSMHIGQSQNMYVLCAIIAFCYVAIYILKKVMFGFIYCYPPGLPSCKNEKCEFLNQYKYKRIGIGKRKIQCRCGMEYEQDGDRVFEIKSDGVKRLYAFYDKSSLSWKKETLR